MLAWTTVLSLLKSKTTWITAGILAVLAVVGVLVGDWVHTRSENTLLHNQVTAISQERDQLVANNKANQKAIETRNETIEALGKVETVERVKTVQALQANPDWAKQPIPADVLASLRN